MEGVHVQRIEQPPYSPELNPAERVLKHLRARIEGKTYGLLEAKQAAVETELKKRAADPEKVKRLVWLGMDSCALATITGSKTVVA